MTCARACPCVPPCARQVLVIACVRARKRAEDGIDNEFQHPQRGAERRGNGLVERLKVHIPEAFHKVYHQNITE